MLVAIIVVILLCSAMSDHASAVDWEASEYNAEQRHRELMELQRHKKTRSTKATRRRAIKDPNGRVICEEVIVESLEDM